VSKEFKYYTIAKVLALIHFCTHQFRTLVQSAYSMVVAIGQLENSWDFWMLSNSLDLETGRTSANISRRVLQKVI